ncbi:hypothetical protein BGX21_000793 [Mortierella sp. AD011]|nr:hypothetical protein BGX21_000793 [Mortierella sp. AD011]
MAGSPSIRSYFLPKAKIGVEVTPDSSLRNDNDREIEVDEGTIEEDEGMIELTAVGKMIEEIEKHLGYILSTRMADGEEVTKLRDVQQYLRFRLMGTKNAEASLQVALGWGGANHSIRLRSKGNNDITSALLQKYVNEDVLPELGTEKKTIYIKTATRWLRALGWVYSGAKKSAYVDGHEWPDVVKYPRTDGQVR